MGEGGPHFKIGALSKQAGCNIEIIRYYERIDLLPVPPRTRGGYRIYDLEHLKRLNFIRRARELGFTLDEVRALLKLADDQNQSCGEARDLAAAHLHEVHTKIANLRAMERVLKELIVRCDTGTLPECPLIEALVKNNSSQVSS